MLLSSFLALLLPVEQAEPSLPIDSSPLKICGIYSQSTITWSSSLFDPMRRSELQLNATIEAFMHFASNQKDARRLFMQEGEINLPCILISLGDYLYPFHARCILELSNACNSQGCSYSCQSKALSRVRAGQPLHAAAGA